MASVLAAQGDRLTAAYGDLRTRILELDLLPGEVVSERELEALLGMSRSPIREALLRLEADGLVLRQKRGYRIAPIDLDEFIQVFEYREAIETAAARHACVRATDAEIEALQKLYDAPPASDSADEWFRTGTDFHVELTVLSGNRFLVTAINDVLTRIARVRWMQSTNAQRRVKGHQAHRDIMAALRLRDAEAAAEASRRHVHEVRDDLVRFLESSERSLRGRGIRFR